MNVPIPVLILYSIFTLPSPPLPSSYLFTTLGIYSFVLVPACFSSFARWVCLAAVITSFFLNCVFFFHLHSNFHQFFNQHHKVVLWVLFFLHGFEIFCRLILLQHSFKSTKFTTCIVIVFRKSYCVEPIFFSTSSFIVHFAGVASTFSTISIKTIFYNLFSFTFALHIP